MIQGNRIFQIAIFVSVTVHGAILAQNTGINFFSQSKKGEEIKVTYIKQVDLPKESRPFQLPKEAPLLKLPEKISLEKRTPPALMEKTMIFNSAKPISGQGGEFSKPILTKPDIIAIKKKITLPPIELSKINNPTYLSYYQIVREKIKRAAYSNYTGKEIGEVTISFVVSDKGVLRDLRLMEDKSASSSYLIEIALKSVKDASPFPVFPKELDYPQLSFNLAITFEIE